MQAGDIVLGHSCGFVGSPIGRKSPAAPSPAILTWMPKASRVEGTMCHVPFLAASKLSLMVTGLYLQRRVLSAAAFDSSSSCCSALGRPWCACWASSAPWFLSLDPLAAPTSSACLEPSPAPGCSSPALPCPAKGLSRESTVARVLAGLLAYLPLCAYGSSAKGNSTQA